MKSLAAVAVFFTMAALLTAGAAPLGGGVPAAVHYIDHDKVSAMLAKVGSSKMVEDPGLTVDVVNRKGEADAEYHERKNHIIIVIGGEATLVVGGTMVGTKRFSPDKTSTYTASLEGGETYHLSKGDVITIPAKTPHWWKEIPATFTCYAIDIDSQQ